MDKFNLMSIRSPTCNMLPMMGKGVGPGGRPGLSPRVKSSPTARVAEKTASVGISRSENSAATTILTGWY